MSAFGGVSVIPDVDSSSVARRSRSVELWKECPPLEHIRNKDIPGIVFERDFDTAFPSDSDAQFVGDASPPALLDTSVDGGILKLQTSNTDNNEAYVIWGQDVGSLGTIGVGVADIWLEARLKVSSITDVGWFLGLGKPGICAANFLVDDTAATADKSFVGFRVLTADADGLDCVYRTESGGGEIVHMEAASGLTSQTLVADRFIKLGLRFSLKTNKMYWYVNGQIVDTAGVAATATDFPNAVAMHFFLGCKTGAAAHMYMYLDWVLCALRFADGA